MTPEQFCCWFKGMSDAIEGVPTPEQWKIICNVVKEIVMTVEVSRAI